jgi:DNA polymerase I-like protein with 3'-5' exonuclease and polymerase domains
VKVTLVTRRVDYYERFHPLIIVVHPKNYNIFEHLLKEGKSKIKDPISYSDWYVLSHDIETNSTDPIGGSLLLSAFCNNNDEVLVIDNTTVNNNEIFTPELLKQCFFIAHNADFEARWGIVNNFLPGRYGCTMVNDKTLLRGQKGYHFDIISVINRRLGYKFIPEWMDKDIRAEFFNHNGIFTPEQILYNAADTIRLKQLYITQLNEASAINQLYLFNSINSRIIIPIAKAEVTGIRHDTEKWISIAKDREQKAKQICQELDKIVLEQYKLTLGSINPAVKKEEEAKIKRDQKSNLRKEKLQNALRELERKEKTHLKSYQKQLEQLDKILSQKGSSGEMVQDGSINWGSQKQVINILTQLGCPLPTGKNKDKVIVPKVSREARTTWLIENEVSEFYEFMKKFDAYKKLWHNVTSFGETWVEKYLNPITNKVHTTLRQADTDTGRMSSGSKRDGLYNGQQIPSGKEYRACFIADEGRRIATNDYTGCELVLMISLSNDFNLKKLSELPDQHSYLGTKCWRNVYQNRYEKTGLEKWKLLAETYEMNKKTTEKEKERHKFKNSAGVFPVAYGIFPGKVAATASVTNEEAQIMIDTIKAEIPKVIEKLTEVAKLAVTEGYVISNTRTNSRRWFTPILDQLHYGFKTSKSDLIETESASRNAPIQSSNADLVKEAIAMIEMWSIIYKVDIRFLLQVHDELLYDVPITNGEVYFKKIQELMIRAANNYLIPSLSMQVDGHLNTHWEK